MTARELFNIILKICGILLLKDSILAVTSLIPMFAGMFDDMDAAALTSIILPLLMLGVYAWIIYLFIFRSSFLIDKLRLTEDFSAEPFTLNFHRSVVLSICFIVSGILLLVNTIPFFLKEIVAYVQSRKPAGIFQIEESFDAGYFIIYCSQIIVAILLIVYQRHFVNFIESRRKK